MKFSVFTGMNSADLVRYRWYSLAESYPGAGDEMKVKPYLYLFLYCLVGALGGLLFGFDTAVIAGTTQSLVKVFNLTPALLGLTVSSALWGTVVSSIFAGIPGDRFGPRESLRVAALLYVISAIGCALAWNLPALIGFRFIGGLAIGISSVLGPVYIAELAPPQWRGRLVGLFQTNIVIGILLAYFSNFYIGTMALGVLDWRVKLGVSAIPAVLFMIMLLVVPRSPRWLVTRNCLAEAHSILEKTGSADSRQELEEIIADVKTESASQNEPLFRKKYRLPIFLAIAIGMFNQLTGINAILYYLNDIFAFAGFNQMSSDTQAVLIGFTNLLFTCVAMALIDKLGRKKLLLVGALGTAACTAGVAAVFFTRTHLDSLVWLLVAYIGFFAFSQGAVIWVYLSEIFPTSVRAKGQSLGSASHWVMNALISAIFPVLAKVSGGYPFAFFALMNVVQFIVVLFVFPETKGISLEQMKFKLGIAQEKDAAKSFAAIS